MSISQYIEAMFKNIFVTYCIVLSDVARLIPLHVLDLHRLCERYLSKVAMSQRNRNLGPLLLVDRIRQISIHMHYSSVT